MEEKMTFKVFDENGKEIECEVLFTFESDETHKNYIVYTDNTTDEDGNTKVYASIYTPDVEKISIIHDVNNDSDHLNDTGQKGIEGDRNASQNNPWR